MSDPHDDPYDDPVSEWLAKLPEGDSLAQYEIWRTFASRIERTARRNLGGVPLGDADGEDIAIRVLKSLFQRLEDGRINPPDSRKELWNLLLGMTRNKSAEAVRKKHAAKRGGGQVRPLSMFDGAGSHGNAGDAIADSRPGPGTALAQAQALADRLDSLEDEQLRQIALLRMAGHSNEEIAQLLGCGKRTVERRVGELRSRLELIIDSGDDNNVRDSVRRE